MNSDLIFLIVMLIGVIFFYSLTIYQAELIRKLRKRIKDLEDKRPLFDKIGDLMPLMVGVGIMGAIGSLALDNGRACAPLTLKEKIITRFKKWF